MKSKNEYIGDEKFGKFLQHYNCPTPLAVIKMRFAGAICSPNAELRPTDVISSFWENNQAPRLETKNEAELFFKFFMGLWDEIFTTVADNKLEMPYLHKDEDLFKACFLHYDVLEMGFIEGFWGGMENVNIPGYIAEVLDSLSQVAQLYKTLAEKIKSGKDNKNIFDAVIDCDKMATKSMAFLVEHYALPHIDELKRTVN